MQIPAKTLKKWKSLKDFGDMKKLAELLDVSTVMVHNIFSKGEASIEQIETIGSFYQEREARAKKIS